MIRPGEIYMADFAEAGPIGKLDDVTHREVIKAVGYVIESDCEPL